MCMVWPCHCFVDRLSKKCIVYKKVKLINRDCLPISMLLYIMLYVMLAYLMLLTALYNSVCLYNAYFLLRRLQMLVVFKHCLELLTQFVYFKYYLASCTVHIICWFC